MIKYVFKFPRIDAESITMEGETYGEAADKAIAERVKHITPMTAEGTVYEPKPSLVNPKPLTPTGGNK
jgi:hypothetical protein